MFMCLHRRDAVWSMCVAVEMLTGEKMPPHKDNCLSCKILMDIALENGVRRRLERDSFSPNRRLVFSGPSFVKKVPKMQYAVSESSI